MEVDPDTPLLFVLNDELGLRGPRFGCGMAQCGACTVIMRGQVVRSCVMPVRAVGQAEITTLEGSRHPREAASYTAGVYRGGSRSVRVLPQRRNPDSEGRSGRKPAGL